MECKHCFSRQAVDGKYWCQPCIDKFNARVSPLRCVKALFGWPNSDHWGVTDVYIVNDNPDLLIGNTDGYDDWGHILKHSPGVHNGEAYDYIDKGRY